MDKREVDELLRRFLDQLKQQKFPESTIQEELRDFVAGGLDRYLRGGSKTLDAAFGLAARRGAAGNPTRRRAIAEAVFPLRRKRWPWTKVIDHLGFPEDEADIRKYYKEFYVALMAEAVSAKLDEAQAGDK